MENLLCESCAEAWPHVAGRLPAGILFDNGNGAIMRCDECALFEDDVAAATFLSALLGEPWLKLFDDDSELPDDPTEEQLRKEDARDRPYRPYFRLSQNEIIERLDVLAGRRDSSAEARLTLERDGLRGALEMLRDALDDEEVADHVPSGILNAVNLILARTEP